MLSVGDGPKPGSTGDKKTYLSNFNYIGRYTGERKNSAAFEGCQLAPRHQRLKRTFPKRRRKVPCSLEKEKTMTRKTLLSRKRQHSLTAASLPVPHPSWSRRERVRGGAALAPDDFWSRLGL